MKMSEFDHTNSLDPDRAQQNVWQDPNEKSLLDLRNVCDEKNVTQHAKSEVFTAETKQKKRCYIMNTMTRVGCMT